MDLEASSTVFILFLAAFALLVIVTEFFGERGNRHK